MSQPGVPTGARTAVAPARSSQPVNRTVIGLTLRVLLGRRRGILFLVLPAALLLLAITLRWAGGGEDDIAVSFLSAFAVGTVLPLLALLAGTGVIGPEIDDGSIVYLLAKPIPRWHIVVSKYLVATGTVIVFGAIPIMACAVVLTGRLDQVALSFGLGAVLAGAGYCAVFLLLAIISRNAVVLGLVYALLWESLIGGFVTGVKTLSIQQWALAVTRESASIGIPGATVQLSVAVPALAITIALATWYAGRRLRLLSITGE